LTDGVFSRPWVRYEINRAIEMKKNIVTISDDFKEFNKREEICEQAKKEKENPGDYSDLFLLEAISYRRRNFEADAMIAELIKRSKLQMKNTPKRSLHSHNVVSELYLEESSTSTSSSFLPTLTSSINHQESPELLLSRERSCQGETYVESEVAGITTTTTVDATLTKRLSNTFKRMDSNSDGKITATEFMNGSSAIIALGSNPDQVYGTFSRMDMNGDGSIDESEFINGASALTNLALDVLENNTLKTGKDNTILLNDSDCSTINNVVPSLSPTTSSIDVAEMVYDAARTIKELRKVEGKKKWPKGTKMLLKQCKQKIMKDSFEQNEFEQLSRHLTIVCKQKKYVDGNEETKSLIVVEELLEFYEWDGSSDDEDE
jgi:Ca2+-binding EF-hand superfamily protein